MPSRYATRRTLANVAQSIESNEQLDIEKNMFDKAFKDEIGGWENWMQWEGDSGVAPGILDRQESASISSTEQWPVDVAASPSCIISPTYNTQYNFEDAPFEFDDGVLGAQPLRTSNTLSQSFRWPIRGTSSLTAVEERNLQDIAMPRHAVSRYKEESNLSSSSSSSPTFSPALPVPRQDGRARKRQKSTGDDEASNTCQSRRRGHNAIEKRYRTNLNEKIVCLRNAIPALRRDSGGSEKSDEGEDSDGESASKQGQQKYGKADILVRALDYIKHLEMTTGRMGGELNVLNTRIEAFEQLAMNGIIGNNGGPGPRNHLMRSETLESIQEDFKQISTKEKSEPRAPAPRRKSSRQSKG